MCRIRKRREKNWIEYHSSKTIVFRFKYKSCDEFTSCNVTIADFSENERKKRKRDGVRTNSLKTYTKQNGNKNWLGLFILNAYKMMLLHKDKSSSNCMEIHKKRKMSGENNNRNNNNDKQYHEKRQVKIN